MSFRHFGRTALLPLILVAALQIFNGALMGIVITPAPRNFVLDGKIEEWTGLPPAVSMGKNGEEGSYDFWLARNPSGFVIAGRVQDSRIVFAKSTAELQSKSRLEIWLSWGDAPVLPPAQYDADRCESGSQGAADKKAACLEWVNRQAELRKLAAWLFTRMWRIAPEAAEESYAAPAFDDMTPGERKLLPFTRPDGLPRSAFQSGPNGKTTFEIAISWAITPPATQLHLDRVGLRMDLLPEIEDVTSIDHNFRSDPEDGLRKFWVTPSISSRLSLCGQPLTMRDAEGNDQPAFYFLTNSLDVSYAFRLTQPIEPSWDPLPRTHAPSLVFNRQLYFSQELSPGEFLCGPFMSYRKGAVIKQFPFRFEPDQDMVALHSLLPLPVKRLADGTRLIRYGPDSVLGPLWRHAWSVYVMRIYALTPQLDVQLALNLFAMFDDQSEHQVEISDDWQTVTVFNGQERWWNSLKYCLQGHIYRSCGKNPHASPPTRPLIPKQ